VFLLLRTQYGHAFQVPREANQRPFSRDFLQAAQGELTESEHGLDDAEHGFDGLLALVFDALRVKIREDAVVRNKAIYLALGVLPDGTRDIFGLWIENTEGAKFWMKVFNDLKTRGVADILIAVTDGLKGMPEALAAVFPRDHPANLHRASDSQQSGLRELEGSQGAGGGDQTDLHGNQRRSGHGRTGGLLARAVGREIPHRGRCLASSPGIE
jgi:hypothetical protein